MNSSATEPETQGLQKLINEVFEATGSKLTADDPLVAAAMIQSSLVRNAVSQACERLVLNINEVARETQLSAQRSSQAQADLVSKSVAKTLQQLIDRSLSTAAVVAASRLRLSIYLLAAAISGALICYFTIQHLHDRDQSQARLLHNGALLDQVWPTLPAETKRLFQLKPPLATDVQKP